MPLVRVNGIDAAHPANRAGPFTGSPIFLQRGTLRTVLGTGRWRKRRRPSRKRGQHRAGDYLARLDAGNRSVRLVHDVSPI